MLEAYIRPVYQIIFVTPVAKLLAGHFTPNQISITSLCIGLVAAVAIGLGSPLTALVLLLISGYLDTLDGTLARLTNTSSDFGSMLDITCDRIVEFAVILGLFAVAPEARGWICMFMLGSVLIVITTFLTAGMFMPQDEQSEMDKNKKSFNYTPALMERAEAFVFFALMMFLPAYFNLLALLFIVLVLYTAARRLWQVKEALG